MDTKVCITCGESKELKDFPKRSDRNKSTRNTCCKCYRISQTKHQKKYREANRIKIRERDREYKKRNAKRRFKGTVLTKERSIHGTAEKPLYISRLEYIRLWRKLNPEKVKEYSKRYEDKHKIQRRAIKKERRKIESLESRNIRLYKLKQWIKANPEARRKSMKKYRAKESYKTKRKERDLKNKKKLQLARSIRYHNNKEQYNNYTNKYRRNNRLSLNNIYVRSVLTKRTGLSASILKQYPEFIESFKEQIKIERLLKSKKKKDENTETS